MSSGEARPGGDVDDVALLVGCADRPELFAVLYRRHLPGLLGWFLRRTGCAQTAADLTAETFAAAYAGRLRFVDTGFPVRAWLFGIARRQLGTYLRKERVADRYRRRMGIGPLVLDDDELDRVERLADLSAWRADLSDALASLPPGQLDAVRLRVVDDLPYAEVAHRLGVTEGAARVRVSRGLSRLAELMEVP